MRAFHGTSSAAVGEGVHVLLPPVDTGKLQEAGRKVRLDCIFATPDQGLARVYAGRAVRRFGGRPVVLEVSIPDRLVEVDSGSRPGAVVLVAPGAWVVSRS
jgi:hypothetical protein